MKLRTPIGYSETEKDINLSQSALDSDNVVIINAIREYSDK